MLDTDLVEYQLNRNDKASVVIQINSLLSPQVFLLPYKDNNIKDRLELEFNDTYQTDIYDAPAMTIEQADKIIDFFIKHLEDANVLIVACDKCIDRANSVVKALADFYSQDISYLDVQRYNKLVYNTLYEQLLKRKGLVC